MGILWLCWAANWEIPLCLCKSYRWIVQHLEWLITTQLVRVLILVGNRNKPLFYPFWMNFTFWHVFVRPHGIHQILKWGSWHVGHVEIMLSFRLCLNMGLNLYTKAQKSSLDWWCHLHVGRYCWMRSTVLSCLLILGPKRCMLYCLLVVGGARCENLVREFVNSVRFVNILKTALRHPQVYWNSYPLLMESLDHSQ